jgi:aryl sulfotransferase
VPESPLRYVSVDEDSARWIGFSFRQGDIVISTRSKSGTTWIQMICALLIFQVPDPPAPLATLSPWLDSVILPKDEVYARLNAQQHRRFIKTHTPLDGIPVDDRATYIVVARHPLDMAVSLYYQTKNLDKRRIRMLTGQSEPVEPSEARPSLREWLLDWIDSAALPRDQMDSLPGVMWHLSDAWARRAQPNVVLLHYDDLLLDLAGEMQRLARQLDIDVPESVWPELTEAATFTSMRSRADQLSPNPSGILKSSRAFFRVGTSGSGRQLLSDTELAHYFDRAGELATHEMLDWLHR